MLRFENRAVIVTGGGSGIGAATVRRLHDEGASVAVVDVNMEAAQRVVAATEGGDRVYAVQCDIGDRERVTRVVAEAAERFGTLYGLANCAGIRGVGSVLDFEVESWRNVIAINLDGTFYMCQAFARVMRDTKAQGAIVNLSSAAGVRGVPNRLAYAASKHGVVGISKTMALELGPLGIRVNAVAPGMIRTPFVESMFTDPANAERIRASHPIGRWGEPEEIASTVAFLLSEDASFITGIVLSADGGKTAGIASH